MDLWTNLAGVTALLPDGRRRWLMDHNREERIPPLARIKGVGNQQQQWSRLPVNVIPNYEWSHTSNDRFLYTCKM